MGAGEDILKRLDGLEQKLDRLLVHLGADRAAGDGRGSGAVATPAQIQGDKGDFEVKLDPQDWSGPSCKGLFVSQCPPEFLDVYADVLDHFADNPRPGKEKFAKYDRLNAARCRRWAIEIREGRHKPQAQAAVPPPPPSSGGPPDYDFGPPPYGDGTSF